MSEKNKMSTKICNLCGGVIPQEKIEEFESKFKAEQSKIKKESLLEYEQKGKEEKERLEERLKQQERMFADFKKILEENSDKEIKRVKENFEALSTEKLKIKEQEVSALNKKLKDAESDSKNIAIKIEKKYEQMSSEFEEIQKKLLKKDEKIIDIQKEHAEQREKLIADFEDKIRKLENKTPIELGEEGQAKVIDILNKTFSRFNDEIIETKRGKTGSDIFHKIVYDNKEVALIIYEVKNTSDWKNDYIAQVKNDKSKHSANYALLVSNLLPSKEKLISEKDGVLIVHPSKIAIIAAEIRNFLIEAHRAKLSGEEIEEKIKVLQEYLISPDYKNALSDLFNATKAWNDIRYKERDVHEKHWAEEEKLNRTIQEKVARIHAKIATIIEGRMEGIPIIVTQTKKKRKAKNN